MNVVLFGLLDQGFPPRDGDPDHSDDHGEHGGVHEREPVPSAGKAQGDYVECRSTQRSPSRQ